MQPEDILICLGSIGLNYLGKSLFILLLILMASFKSYSCTLTLGISTESSPYLFEKTDQGWSGVSIDLAKTLAKKADCELKIISAPWGRAIKLLESGKIHFLTNFTHSKSRAKFADFIGPHYIESATFVARKTISANVNSPKELHQFTGTVGIQRGANFGHEFENLILKNPNTIQKLVYLPNIDERYSMLKLGRLDGVFDDQLIAHHMLETGEISKDEFSIRFFLHGTPTYFGISKKAVSKKLKNKLQKAWLTMREEHLVEKIYEKYGLTLNTKQLFKEDKLGHAYKISKM
ncbi:transporter substrate-binding domain-containing protein [Psychrosphaera sp. 1_MG-2023]|uniref:substrate-binding periplasmic protein n=1 Tax=Psychrosphaera sp. 1_MG-2023 TaxID=3062643 RepID=UPI0026E2C3B4|nr:transporter substrate-binding domain-containing protein [Psychrosphaera sp. 1_MG-2023]MDO6719869.1 transporter substrate-binding domain-containing protein [Psychrosphaera sp. 1_MG-2023]